MDKCLICGAKLATKKNSHLIPSFLLAPIFNYDGSTKRGKEVMFTISPTGETVYVGELPDTKLETLFDSESPDYDDRASTEFRENTASKDFIFCPECEANLSTYLETPYSESYKENKCTAEVSFFFWLSVIWRISISEQFGVRLDNRIEDNLGECLKNYFIIKRNEGNDGEIDAIINKAAFTYRLLRCPDYVNDQRPGFVVAQYDSNNKVLTVMIGELILYASFAGDDIPETYSLWGIEKLINKARPNNGKSTEYIYEVSADFLLNVIDCAKSDLAKQKADMEYTIFDACWHVVGLEGHAPKDIFCVYMDKLLDEDKKIGDRTTKQRRVDVFNETLQSFGFTPKEDIK